METNSHFFYVLLCNDNSLYAGYTNDLQKRLKTHNEGKGAKYTRARRPVSLYHAESFDTKREAMQAEYCFKQLSRKKKEQYIEEKRSSKEAVYVKSPDEF
ncbi:GIY-YIG nuclease family protein [Bacillus siamensis]|uniref:GIY-YIG nuclease family protein n=1 Tax=Bacillus siamensis TaxID=659243 RepID=UPI00345991DA